MNGPKWPRPCAGLTTTTTYSDVLVVMAVMIVMVNGW
jgi:hypothetical protein